MSEIIINLFITAVILLSIPQTSASYTIISRGSVGSSWAGVWQSKNGEIIIIREQNGFLDVSGQDKASIYTYVCLVDNNKGTAKCVGEGMNYIKNQRFLYQSTIFKNTTGKLDETWQAFFAGEKLNGKAIFHKNK